MPKTNNYAILKNKITFTNIYLDDLEEDLLKSIIEIILEPNYYLKDNISDLTNNIRFFALELF